MPVRAFKVKAEKNVKADYEAAVLKVEMPPAV